MNQDPYEQIATFYEQIMGEREDIPFLLKLLKKEHPKAKNLLELACGSGTVLGPLSAKYDVTGVDVSKPMLERARSSILHAELHLADIRSLRLKKKYDLVICVFDSINHIHKFSDWQRVFKVASKHLKEDGLFIFDMNTKEKFKNYIEESPLVADEDGDTVIFEVTKEQGDKYDLNIRYFAKQSKNDFKLHTTKITERTYPVTKVKASLKALFKKVKTIDETGKKPNKSSETIYWICRK